MQYINADIVLIFIEGVLSRIKSCRVYPYPAISIPWPASVAGFRATKGDPLAFAASKTGAYNSNGQTHRVDHSVASYKSVTSKE